MIWFEWNDGNGTYSAHVVRVYKLNGTSLVFGLKLVVILMVQLHMIFQVAQYLCLVMLELSSLLVVLLVMMIMEVIVDIMYVFTS